MTTGSSPTPSASSAGSMKKPKPSETISIGILGRLRAPDERHESRVVRLRRGRREERLGRDVDHRHLELHQPA